MTTSTSPRVTVNTHAAVSGVTLELSPEDALTLYRLTLQDVSVPAAVAKCAGLKGTPDYQKRHGAVHSLVTRLRAAMLSSDDFASVLVQG